jgi:hypothetical protein
MLTCIVIFKWEWNRIRMGLQKISGAHWDNWLFYRRVWLQMNETRTKQNQNAAENQLFYIWEGFQLNKSSVKAYREPLFWSVLQFPCRSITEVPPKLLVSESCILIASSFSLVYRSFVPHLLWSMSIGVRDRTHTHTHTHTLCKSALMYHCLVHRTFMNRTEGAGRWIYTIFSDSSLAFFTTYNSLPALS